MRYTEAISVTLLTLAVLAANGHSQYYYGSDKAYPLKVDHIHFHFLSNRGAERLVYLP